MNYPQRKRWALMPLHDKQQEAIEKILSGFDGDMAKVLLEIERLLNRYMLSGTISTKNSLAFDIEFNRILQEAGYYDLVNRMVDTDYDKLFSFISEGFTAGGLALNYTTEDVKRVMALKVLQVNNFTVVGSTAGTTLRENLFKYSLSNYTAEDMQAQIMEDFKGTNLVKYSKTLANTSISEFHESMIDIGVEGLDVVWVYRGARNSRNRDYCTCILDKKAYYDDSEKNKLQRDKRRRYNCVHHFSPVTEDYAKHIGFRKSTGALC